MNSLISLKADAMTPYKAAGLLVLFSLFVNVFAGYCAPSPAFPVPIWDDSDTQALQPTLKRIEKKLAGIVAKEEYNASSFSIAITSGTNTLWSGFHTAVDRNESRKGTKEVDENSQYRIASITKVFTVLGVLKQHAAGNLSLDDPINKYIPGLPPKGHGGLPWKDITLRILASQLSGIPREFAQSDLIDVLPDPSAIGLPIVSREDLPACDEYNNYVPCNSSELLQTMDKKAPVFAPNFQSTYSNVAFELLGLAIENVTGIDYSTYIQHAILDDINMTMTSLEKPSDKHAVIPKGEHYWDVEEGVQRPTGGIYASARDMSKFARYILTHYNALATGVNWLQPASWASGINSFYGMPFEIFRTDKILENTKRPVTFVNKGGGLPGYLSDLEILPEYGLGITLLVAGSGDLIGELKELVTVEIVRAAEGIAWANIKADYVGHYGAIDRELNSSITLSVSPSEGLQATSFISNGSDILGSVIPARYFANRPYRNQLVPTLLYKDEENQRGEIFRMLVLAEPKPDAKPGVWDDFCITDVDVMVYAGKPLNEVVFWHDEGTVELPAWNLKASRSSPRQRTADEELQEVLKLDL